MRAIIAPVIFLLSFSRCFPPKDSFRFNLFHLNRRNRQRNRQTDSVPSQNWSLRMVTDASARVCIFTTHQRGKQNCVALNRLATHLLCSTDPLQMIGSRVVVIINFALFWASSSPPGFLSICLKSNNTSRWTGVDTYIVANLLLLF
jgi:hypothetical protein